MAHILLVDEQNFAREFLLHEVAQMGHRVSCVSDRDSLFLFLEDFTPDLVLLDPNLNGFMGWDLLKEIKRPGRPRIPTLLFTSFQANLADSLASLADGYVIKSVDTKELGQKMAEMLSDGSPVSMRGKRPGSNPKPAYDKTGHLLSEEQGDKTYGRP